MYEYVKILNLRMIFLFLHRTLICHGWDGIDIGNSTQLYVYIIYLKNKINKITTIRLNCNTTNNL